MDKLLQMFKQVVDWLTGRVQEPTSWLSVALLVATWMGVDVADAQGVAAKLTEGGKELWMTLGSFAGLFLKEKASVA